MKAKVNTAFLLKTICRLARAEVKFTAIYHWNAKPSSPPDEVNLYFLPGYICGGDTVGEFTNNGYRFVNASCNENGLTVNFKRADV